MINSQIMKMYPSIQKVITDLVKFLIRSMTAISKIYDNDILTFHIGLLVDFELIFAQYVALS